LGSSTGALLTPLVAVEQIQDLKEAYTNVRQKDIFKTNPFRIIQNRNGVTKIGVNYWNVFWNIFIKKQKSFGDSSNLKTLIKKFITHETYKKLMLLDCEVVVCVTNATLGKSEYKSNKNYEWDDFCDWMYASACSPPFMSLVEKDGYEYTDGGVLEHVPIQEAINKGATEIDVIVLRTEEGYYKLEKMRNAFHWIVKFNELQFRELNRYDIQIPKLKVLDNDVILNIYYTPRVLTNNELIFDKGIMLDWWTEGFECGKNGEFKSYLLSRGRKPKIINHSS
jgi:predicted patatin/cPLA2 family phospholipase